jgi:hypothetical protein
MIERLSGRQSGTLLVGLLLVVGGLAAFFAQSMGANLGEIVGAGGRPFLVILPGLALIVGAFLAPRPNGVALAIAGAIVTTVGGILLYQNATENWESWAYVWALIPTAAGVAMTAYGTLTRQDGLVVSGTRLALIGVVLFLAGLWFFGSLFSTGEVPVDFGTWWPVVLIVIGGAVVLSAFGGSDTTAHPGARGPS